MTKITEELKGAEYIGDGVYMRFDGFHFWLMASDGLSVTDRIALEDHTLNAMESYIQRIQRVRASLGRHDDRNI